MAVEPVHSRIRRTVQLPEIHVKRGPEVHRRVDAARLNWEAKLAYRLTRVEEATHGTPLGITHGRGAVASASLAIKQGKDRGVMEGEGGVPVKAEASTGAAASAGGHGGVGDVDDLVGIVDVGNIVRAGVGGEGETVVSAGDVGREAGGAAAGGGTERVLELELAACFWAGLG